MVDSCRLLVKYYKRVNIIEPISIKNAGESFGKAVEDSAGRPYRPIYRILTVVGMSRQEMVRFMSPSVEIYDRRTPQSTEELTTLDSFFWWLNADRLPLRVVSLFKDGSDNNDRAFTINRREFGNMLEVNPMVDQLSSQGKRVKLRYSPPQI